MWTRGKFDTLSENDTTLTDPWSQTGAPNTPFDQPFYLILNVAVGGTNGWFRDGVDQKPWVDASGAEAPRTFGTPQRTGFQRGGKVARGV